MAASLAPIAETWPENVLTSIVSRKSLTRKIIACPFPLYRFNGFNGLFFDQADNPCNLVNP